VWGALRQHLTERHGVEFASGGDISRGRQFLKSGYPHMLGDVRLVIAINIFHEEIKWYSEDSLKLIFEYRERTRGTRDEIVFLLLNPPKALDKFEDQIQAWIGPEKLN